MKGTVQWFDEKKGIGFIVGDDDQSYFVHYKEIQSNKRFKTLTKGSEVTFTCDKSPKGLFATNIQELEV